MSVTLTKIIDGKPTNTSDTVTNGVTVCCPRCEQAYWLSYSDGEWNKVKDWLKPAESAIRKDQGLRHEALTIPLEWRGIHRR